MATGIAAIPAPDGAMHRSSWRDPTVRAELEAWGERLEVEPAVLEDRLYRFARRYMDLRRRALAPIRPYLRATGCHQPWRMFVAPHRFPSRFQVQARRERDGGEDGWQTVFEERSRDDRWRARFFEQERVRSLLFRYAWPEYGADARRSCDWIARELFADRPDVLDVRCRFHKVRSPSHDEARAGEEPEGSWIRTRVVKRERAFPP